MKQILTIVGLTISLNAMGQPLTYKGDVVDTLKILSNSNYYHFDRKGTTTGMYEEYILAFNKEKNNYILNPYKRTKYKFTLRPDALVKKGKILKKNRVVDRILIANLLKQFEISYLKPTFDNIGLSHKEFLCLTNKKHIIQVAKWHNVAWHFKKAYSMKEDNEILFKGCQNTDTLNVYLSTAFDTSGYVMFTDVDSHFDVIISTMKSDYRFEGKYPNPFRQPWYNHTDTTRLISPSILNFLINNALIDLLPDTFHEVESLKFEALINDYIAWYLERQGIIL